MRVCAFFLLLSCALAHADERSVLVKTQPMHRALMQSTLTGYGTVFPDPSGQIDFNLPRSGQIMRMAVTAGQSVKRGSLLFEFATDPSAENGYMQAQSAQDAAKSGFDSTKRLFDQHLATNAQLAAAKKALQDAQGALRTQKALGAGIGKITVRAPYDGVVTAVTIVQGERMQAGKSILQLARRGSLQVRIGIEPEDAAKVQSGMQVALYSVYDKSVKLHGKVVEIGGMVDSRTHLVDAIVRSDQAGGLMPGMKLRCEIEISGRESWLVPRSAVLSDENGAYLFQGANGRARRIAVSAQDDGELTAIRGKFDPALPVVVLGNYELHDGMKLRLENR